MLRIVHAGDAAMLVELSQGIDPITNARTLALGRAIAESCVPALRDVVAGFCSVTVYFDPLLVDTLWLEAEIRRIATALPQTVPPEGRLVDVPVCYGGEFGPDLSDVAASAGLSESEVVAIHCGVRYRVYMMGFLPGFAYMAAVDPRLALPRRATPRQRVPAGSVAIAAGQTAIYPMETPGGWHVIGRTPLETYDSASAQPCLLSAGDEVRFHPVDRSAMDVAG